MQTKSTSRLRHRAFTLIELLAVIAIIGILAAILIPTVGKVRETARRAQAISKVRQAIIATMSYGNENKGRPPYSSKTGGIPDYGGTPHAYSDPIYEETLKPWLGDRLVAMFCSDALARAADKYNPDKQREQKNANQTVDVQTHLAYFQRDAHATSGKARDEYLDLFKDLNNPPMEYAIWGTLAFASSSKTLAYAEANDTRPVPLTGMFAGYADCSVKWYNRDQLVPFSADGFYYWPKPGNE
ncbi:MAG: prepilin-type N-terminal cleavage/methylation domain-containing protein [Opitutaceae bacterium]|jgi:general secretion pathway protein G|nr:prepilin-type N-terminal cleavage/methylation domain-containing protein [Opitutaceae bacterium]